MSAQRSHRRAVGRSFAGLCLLLLAAACSDQPLGPNGPAPPVQNDGWVVAAPAEVGLDFEALEEVSARIRAGEFRHVHSLLVVRDGRLAYDEYYNEHARDSLHSLQSVTKSVASTLIGIAWDQGLLDLDAALPELLPNRAAAMAADPRKGEVRLRDVLSMQVGLRWDEWSCSYRDSSCNSNRQMNESGDWVGYVLDQPVVENPGTRFVYNSGASNLLAAILLEATGQDPVAFAEEHLFGPLDISRNGWFRNTDHTDALPHFGGGLRLRSRDLAKLGQLFLDGGVWNGRRVVSQSWVEASGQVRAQVSSTNWYGFQWWLRRLDRSGHTASPTDIRFGWGFGGQHVFVVPSLDLVVATNSWNEDGGTKGFEILEAVLEAVR